MEIFILKEKIQPKQRPRFFRGVVYTPSETTKSENHIKKAYLQQCRNVFFEAIELDVKIYVGIKDKKRWGEYCQARPDLDNTLKTICDGLNGVAYRDDGQISRIKAQKIYAPFDYNIIKIKKI